MNWSEEKIVAEDVAAAGRLVGETVAKDLVSSDLYDSLDSARFATQPYSSPPREWPCPVEVVNARELPPVLIERYNAAGGQGTALCGLFPSIRRAWATVDNSLFLWRFDKWDGQCPEYSGEEQALCAVGLAKVRAGIFVEAIQYLLVLATPVEIILLGVCCTSSNDGADPYYEVTLQPLPEYTIPSDGVTMTCIESTDKGRIFLAGRDGHLYELLYTTGAGWKSRCRKICHTGGLGSLLTRWVLPNAFNFGAVDPIVEIAIDNDRNILYSRSQQSRIQVFDLGKNGDSALKKVAEERNVGDQRDSRHGSSRPSGGRSASRLNKTSVVSLATISPMESKWLHLVAVLSDGRRVFLSTSSSMGSGGGINGSSASFQRPSVLRVVVSRPPPPVGGTSVSFGSLSVGARAQTEVLNIEAAHYSCGTFMLSDSSPPSVSRLLVATKDVTNSSMVGGLSLGSTPATGRNTQTLREMVSTLGVDGRTLSMADVLPLPEQLATVESYPWEVSDSGLFEEVSDVTRTRRLWSRGDLAVQHILPRRRAVVFCNMGLMEIVFNRPVDLLEKLLEANTSWSVLEDVFKRHGAGEAAAMSLLLAARLTSDEDKAVSSIVAERAAEAFEDPRLVGVPQMQGSGAMANAVSGVGGGFNMGQVVQEAAPIYSGAHEGLCLVTARLLQSVWELPIMRAKGDLNTENGDSGIVTCRLPVEAMYALESKIRSLEQFLRSRRNQRRGQYGRVVGAGDTAGLYANGHVDVLSKNLFDSPSIIAERSDSQSGTVKRKRAPYSPSELAAMEVRSMELIRRLLRRCGEALLLLQLLSQHHVARLVQSLDSIMRRKLVHLTFHQLVCSEDGKIIATQLVAALMEYYIGKDGKGTVDDISVKLREGCPSYYRETDYTFYQAVECLEKASSSHDDELRHKFAREALDLLGKVPETADLLSVCHRFEEIRFYEAVVELPLRKAKSVDPNEDAYNERIDDTRRQQALAARRECFDIVSNALRHLKEEIDNAGTQSGFGSPGQHSGRSRPDWSANTKYIRQIVELSMRCPDRHFHEYLYQTMIEIGAENELLDFAGPDLVPFLENAGSYQSTKASYAANRGAMPSVPPSVSRSWEPVTAEQAKYLELLSRYYVHRRQHKHAALVLLRLAERKQVDGEQLTLEQRYQYLSNAVLQARTANSGLGSMSSDAVADGGLLELLESKLAVLRFQLKIREELERVVAKADVSESAPSNCSFSQEALSNSAKEKSSELERDIKSITQLYNDYAVPFELWEICLEILHFSNYTGDANNNIMRETWARLLDKALQTGGVAEASTVLKRVGPQLYPGDGGSLPLDTICLHLEKAALERTASNLEVVGDEDIARALLSACKGSPELVLRTYDQLLASGAILPSPLLRLRMLCSVLTVVREWALSALAQHMGTSVGTASLVMGRIVSLEQTEAISQGTKNKLISAANRYMTEIKRLALPPSQVDAVYRGFKELEQMLLGSSSFKTYM